MQTLLTNYYTRPLANQANTITVKLAHHFAQGSEVHRALPYFSQAGAEAAGKKPKVESLS